MTLPPALRIVADRVYQRDPIRFRRLIVWIHDAHKHNWSHNRIRRALLALDKRESEGHRIESWWPWLNAALEKVRTLELEEENNGFKTAEPNRIRAILGKIFRDMQGQ